MSDTSHEEEQYYSLIKRAFDILAPVYDLITLPISGVRGRAVAFTNARAGDKVLDIATGTGKQAFAFARRGYDVTGIDLSEAMLKIAKRKNRYPNVRFQTADATGLPFESGSFDVTCISFALHDMPLFIRKKVLKEMVRVTRPDGRIIIVDYALPKNRVGRFIIFHLNKLYESHYYVEFIRSDFEKLLRESGIEVKERLRVMSGAGRILKGARA